jgi:hypothetical protein
LARDNVTYLKNTLKIIKGEYFIHVQMSSWNNVCTILFIKVNWECSVLIVKFILTVSNVQSFIYLQQLREDITKHSVVTIYPWVFDYFLQLSKTNLLFVYLNLNLFLLPFTPDFWLFFATLKDQFTICLSEFIFVQP